MLFVQPYLYNEWEDYSKANWFLCTLKTSEYTIPLFPLGFFFFFFSNAYSKTTNANNCKLLIR